MLIFCNGIAGCGEKEYLEKFRALCEEKGRMSGSTISGRRS